jgi:hypothetical protein
MLRVNAEEDFALGNELNELSRAEIKKIGNTKAFNARIIFFKNVQEWISQPKKK